MAEQDTGDPNSPNPPQGPLTVSGGAQQLLDRFPEEPSSPKKPDPEPVDTEEASTALPADTSEPDAADSAGLEDEPEEPKSPPLHKVEVDGVEMEITTDEALQGYSRTADYRKKTRQLADDRRKVETEVQAARQARDAYAEKLALVDQALADEPTPDWAKIEAENPEDFPTLQARWQVKQEERQQVKVERKRVTDEQAQEQAQHLQVALETEYEHLKELVPELGDSTKSAAIKDRWAEGAEHYGFTRQEVAAGKDSRYFHMLDDALKYRAIVARKGTTTEATKQATTPTVAPGGRPPSTKGAKAKRIKKEAQERLQRTGRLDDAVEAILHMDD